MSAIVERREPLADYPRSPDAPLGTIQISDSNRQEVERARSLWSTYLRCDAQPPAALSTQYAPLLLDLVLSGSGDGLPVVPGSHYPAGFRRQVLGHTAFPADAIGQELSAEDESTLPYLSQLRAMLEPDSAVAPATLVSLAQLLNVLSLYRVAARSLARRAGALGDPLLVYEVARSVYWLEADPDRAVRPFQVLARASDYPLPVRLSAFARLIAHYCRRDRDLTACAEWAEAARRAIDAARTDERFDVRMGISRIYRALALYAMRRRDTAEVREMMTATLAIARELVAGARTRAEYVAAAQDERLGVEAGLKAFIGSGGRAMVIDLDPLAAVDRILALDPGDPYTQLYTGDALWLLGQDERAVERFQAGGSLGTFPGALAAHRAGVVLRFLGRPEEAAAWFARAAELDPAARAAAAG